MSLETLAIMSSYAVQFTLSRTHVDSPSASSGITTDQTAKEDERADQTPRSTEGHGLDEALRSNRLALDFSRDAKSGAIVVRLIDQQTGEIVRQIPSDVSLKLAEAFAEFQGRFVNRSV